MMTRTPHVLSAAVIATGETGLMICRRSNVDTSVMGLANLALLAWFVEGDDAARQRAAIAVERAEISNKPIGTAYGFGFAALVHQLAGDTSDAHRLALRAAEITSARGIVYWSALAQVLLGWTETMSGNTDSGLVRLRAGIAGYRRTQGEILRPYTLILLAEALGASGRFSEALEALHEAEQGTEAIEARMYVPLLGWIRGQFLARAGNADAGALLEASRLEALRQGASALAQRIVSTPQRPPT